LSSEKNPGRKKPFDIRCVMPAVRDQDPAPIKRWIMMRDADTAVIWDAHLGGNPVCLIGNPVSGNYVVTPPAPPPPNARKPRRSLWSSFLGSRGGGVGSPQLLTGGDHARLRTFQAHPPSTDMTRHDKKSRGPTVAGKRDSQPPQGVGNRSPKPLGSAGPTQTKSSWGMASRSPPRLDHELYIAVEHVKQRHKLSNALGRI
jgi:hypothetical protein